jgi:hypothetical protein
VFHLLVVGPAPAQAPPSFELIRAATPEDAVELLARNRRIDAVLVFGAELARETAALLAEVDPQAPPLFEAGEEADPFGAVATRLS